MHSVDKIHHPELTPRWVAQWALIVLLLLASGWMPSTAVAQDASEGDVNTDTTEVRTGNENQSYEIPTVDGPLSVVGVPAAPQSLAGTESILLPYTNAFPEGANFLYLPNLSQEEVFYNENPLPEIQSLITEIHPLVDFFDLSVVVFGIPRRVESTFLYLALTNHEQRQQLHKIKDLLTWMVAYNDAYEQEYLRLSQKKRADIRPKKCY
jgi:hypothetical protein